MTYIWRTFWWKVWLFLDFFKLGHTRLGVKVFKLSTNVSDASFLLLSRKQTKMRKLQHENASLRKAMAHKAQLENEVCEWLVGFEIHEIGYKQEWTTKGTEKEALETIYNRVGVWHVPRLICGVKK